MEVEGEENGGTPGTRRGSGRPREGEWVIEHRGELDRPPGTELGLDESKIATRRRKSCAALVDAHERMVSV